MTALSRPNSALRKSSSLALSTLIFVSQTVLGHAVETNFWSQRKKLGSESTQLAQLPASFAISNTALSSIRTQKSTQFIRSISPNLETLIAHLPSQWGTIRHIEQPKNSLKGVILYFQDVHMNAEAQTAISRSLTRLNNERAIDLIALEGGFTPLENDRLLEKFRFARFARRGRRNGLGLLFRQWGRKIFRCL